MTLNQYLFVKMSFMFSIESNIMINVAIQVQSSLSVTMQPAGQLTADIGSRAELTCVVTGGSATGGAAQRVWLKDGHVIVPASSAQDQFLISRVQREDAGMYQCLVRGETESAQSSVQLVLGCKYKNITFNIILIILIVFI